MTPRFPVCDGVPASGLARGPLWAAAVLLAVLAQSLSAETRSDGEKGKKQFLYCIACHTVEAAGRQRRGPHLEGLVGRPSGVVEGFAYSDNMPDPPVTWTEEQLDAWLAAPHELAPRMCPGYTGIRDPERRRALIIYLKDPAAY